MCMVSMCMLVSLIRIFSRVIDLVYFLCTKIAECEIFPFKERLKSNVRSINFQKPYAEICNVPSTNVIVKRFEGLGGSWRMKIWFHEYFSTGLATLLFPWGIS